MHALSRFAAVALLLFLATSALADDQKSAANAAAGDQKAVTKQQDNSNATAARWRYRRHNGRWWYYTPANNWMVFHNNAWAPYRAGMFASEQRMTSQPVRRYSYDPGFQGNAGYYPRIYRAPGNFGVQKSIRYAGSKINADYAPYTGGSMQ
ncbi:MAG TPA: hypothetical protein VHD36_13840 [Pirellulales bacterium]|nr:hypothetical protein [Pirellulales bacterium]